MAIWCSLSCVTYNISCLLINGMLMNCPNWILTQGGREQPTCSLFCLACIFGTRNGHRTLADGPVDSYLQHKQANITNFMECIQIDKEGTRPYAYNSSLAMELHAITDQAK